MIPRSRTSYDFYRDRQKDYDLTDYLPGLPNTGNLNPSSQPNAGNLYPSAQPYYSYTGNYPSSQANPGNLYPSLSGGVRASRPASRISATRLYPNYEDRPKSGGLELHNNPYTNIDPFNRHYYYRVWQKDPPRPQKPICREGRCGSAWRHIKTTTSNGGNHLAFIDGTIKSEENLFFPPEEGFEPPNFTAHVTPRMAAAARRATFMPGTGRRSTKETAVNWRAKQGFKYWPHQHKPINYTHY